MSDALASSTQAAGAGVTRRSRAQSERSIGSAVVLTLYILFLLLPIYWLVNMSLKTNSEILGGFSLWPRNLTFRNYETILTTRPGTWAMSTA
jgi:glycerol transport system permease protein